MQSKTNIRTDEYGGSYENKFRFLREILEAILTVWPASRIAVRLSPNGNYNDMGHADNHETFSYVVAQLEKYGLSYLHLVDGLAFGFHNLCKQFTLYDARKVGYTGIMMCNNGYTREHADGVIGSGVVDMVSFGRAFMSNPDLIERFTNNWPLAETAEYKAWWSAPYEDCSVGYPDFPRYTPPDVEERKND